MVYVEELDEALVIMVRFLVCRQCADNRQCADTFFIKALYYVSISDNVPTIFSAVVARNAFGVSRGSE